MARIRFVRPRTVNQIANKCRACRHPVEKVRWHAVWLLARADSPRTPALVATSWACPPSPCERFPTVGTPMARAG